MNRVAPSQCPTTILVVDDDPDVLWSTSKILRDAGFVVLEGAGAVDAIKLTKEYCPALVLLDVNLPDGDGIDIALQIKKDPLLYSVFVVLCSGERISPKDQADGLRRGLADGYIIRPVGKDELIARIDAYIRIRATQEALRESRRQLDSMATNIPGVVFRFYVNPDGRTGFDYISKRSQQILGLENNTATFDNQFTACFDPDNKKRFHSSIQHAISTKTLWEFESQYTKPSGEKIWINAISSPLMENERLIFDGVMFDITERMRMEDALALSSKKLNLLSSITRHDILNQVTALLMYLDIVSDEPMNQKLSESLDHMKSVAKTIQHQIEFTREYQDLGILAPLWQDCRKLVDTAADQATLGQVMVKNDLPADAEVFADPLIVKVFYNLMDNAVRYGGKITTIRFFVEEAGNEHRIVCEDDGDGVVADEKEKIFELGFGKSTGLGLFLSQVILDITEITIAENGEPGKGARFEILVPKGMYRFAGLKESD